MMNEALLRQTKKMIGLDYPAWLKQWSEDQLMHFINSGWPTSQLEDWKYIQLTALSQQNFVMYPQERACCSVPRDVSAYFIPNTYRAVFIDGYFMPHFSVLGDQETQRDFVVITHTGEAIKSFDDDTRLKWGSLVPSKKESSIFSFLNGGLITDGLFIHVPAKIKLVKPIHLLYLNTGEIPMLMTHPRHHIRVAAGSELCIFEEYVSASNTCYFNNVVTQIEVGCQATVQHYKLQRESCEAYHVANIFVSQQQDSHVGTYHMTAGANLSRDNLDLMLREKGACCELRAFYAPRAKQQIDHHTSIQHLQTKTQSYQCYKGIIADQAKAIFNGKIIVQPQAQQVSAQQMNHNLLLGKTAEINTKPELAIYANNIQCSHGATVGQLDAAALFYLRSRGIAENEARRLLTLSFADEILLSLPNPLIKKVFQQYAVSMLSQLLMT